MYALWQLLFQRFFRHIVAATDTSRLPKEPFILVSNHIDWLDGLLLSVVIWPVLHRKIAFLARTNNWRIFDTALIQVDQPRKTMIRTMHAALTEGHLIGIFIEGYRNPQPELAKGKVGAVRFAIESGAPVVPVGISGMSHPSTIASLRHLRSNPPHISFGDPRDYRAYTGRADDKQLLDRLTTALMVDIGQLCNKPYPYA